jgi:hypothetical protein
LDNPPARSRQKLTGRDFPTLAWDELQIPAQFTMQTPPDTEPMYDHGKQRL